MTDEQRDEILRIWVPEAIQADPVLRKQVQYKIDPQLVPGGWTAQPQRWVSHVPLQVYGEYFCLQFDKQDNLRLDKKNMPDVGSVELAHPDFQAAFSGYLKLALAAWYHQRYIALAKRTNIQQRRCETFGGVCEPVLPTPQRRTRQRTRT